MVMVVLLLGWVVGIPYSPSTGPSGIGAGTVVKWLGAGCGRGAPNCSCGRAGGTTGTGWFGWYASQVSVAVGSAWLVARICSRTSRADGGSRPGRQPGSGWSTTT